MVFPFITAFTAGSLLILQMLLGFLTSGARGTTKQWIGNGDSDPLLRAVRRHGNLAENSAIFVAGFLLLELSRWNQGILIGMSGAFLALRLVHALGLSLANTNNVFRLLGGVGTYLLGFVLGGILVWIAIQSGQPARALG